MAMRAPPRVVHVVVSLDHGGLEKLVVNWTNARNERFPNSTTICCLDRLGDLAGEVLDGSLLCVEADRSKFPMDFAAVRRIRAHLRASPNTIVHSHNLAAQQYTTAAVFGSGIRHIHTEHGTNSHFEGAKNRFRVWLMSKMTDRIVAVSEDTATALVRDQLIPRSKLLVVRNGVSSFERDGVRPREELLSELGIHSSAVVIGSVGRLAYVKGYDRLLAAFAELCVENGRTQTSVPEFTEAVDRPEEREAPGGSSASTTVLLLVGDGPEREALENQSKALGIANRVVFAGYRKDATLLLGVMDLFILPSRSEGLSIALLEAMSIGVPVLVTDVGENRVVLNDGEYGELLPPDDRVWCGIIGGELSLLSSRFPILTERAEKARTRIPEEYSEAATLKAYEREYGGLLCHR